MKRALVLLSFLAAALPAAQAAPSGAKFLPQLLREVEEKYTKANTLEAQFTQVNESASLGTKKTSAGLLLVKRPGKVRWETHKPDPNILVSDGKTFWYYTPPFEKGENGQLIERKSSAVQPRLAQALLSGAFSVAKDMKIETLSASRFALVPKKGTAGTVVRAEIEIDTSLRLINKVILKHRDGNRAEISLSAIQLGKPIGDEAFRFVAPPNTDRVKE